MKKFIIIILWAIFSFSTSFGNTTPTHSRVESDKIFSRESGGFGSGGAGNGFARESGGMAYDFSENFNPFASGAGNGFGKEGVGFQQKSAFDFHTFGNEGHGFSALEFTKGGHGFSSQFYGGRN
ncbi:MAG: hypothetical protein AAF696_18970, partial [Bacteroidota bacterium]